MAISVLLSGRGGLPANVSRELLSSGRIRINGRTIASDVALKLRDEVVAHVLTRVPIESAFQPSILLSDEHVLAIDKPAGIPSQGTESDAQSGLDFLLTRWLIAQGEQKPLVGVVHRLDLETSGVLLFGRSALGVRSLNEQFQAGRVEKRYELLTAGAPTWGERIEDGPIGPDPMDRGSFRVSSQGRPARTRFRVLARYRDASRWEALPETGRTHQIRVHAAAAGHPLLGDRRYGGPAQLTRPDGQRIDCPRVALHAASLTFDHPAGGRRTLAAPWPADLSDWEKRLESASQAS